MANLNKVYFDSMDEMIRQMKVYFNKTGHVLAPRDDDSGSIIGFIDSVEQDNWFVIEKSKVEPQLLATLITQEDKQVFIDSNINN